MSNREVWLSLCARAGRLALAVSALVIFAPIAGFGQAVPLTRDPLIAQMVDEVSAARIEQNIRTLVGFHTRHSLSSTTDKSKGIGAARNWIKAEMEKYAADSGGRLQVEFDDAVVEPDGRRIPYRVTMKNVLARLPGTDANDTRVFIVSGHYDSRASGGLDSTSAAPGANDDGSGTAVTMELARVMSKAQFPATIIFATVAGEEQGLYGSAHLAQRAKDEGWNVVGMITNDIVGNTLSNGTNLKDNGRVRVFSEGIPAVLFENLRSAIGDENVDESGAASALQRYLGAVGENDSPARQFARYIKEMGERYVDQMEVVVVYRRDRFLRGGDHTPFSRLGFTAVRMTEMNENFNHQHQDVRVENGVQFGDLPEFVDYEYAAKVARVNLAALANLALAPPAPENVRIVVSRLTNETTLRWQKPSVTRPIGFIIRMRETSSPVWQTASHVGDVTETTLPYSKDNYLFAVQSVDAAGHASLPVFPTPGR